MPGSGDTNEMRHEILESKRLWIYCHFGLPCLSILRDRKVQTETPPCGEDVNLTAQRGIPHVFCRYCMYLRSTQALSLLSVSIL
jgi:hypothetical protein